MTFILMISCFVVQVMVIQYIRGRLNAEKGFPSAEYVTPIEEYPTNQNFYVPSDGSQNAFVTLVTTKASAATLVLDSNVRTTGWEDLHQASVYQALQVTVPAGIHTITHTAPVGVFIYAERSTCAFNFAGQMNVIPYNEVCNYLWASRSPYICLFTHFVRTLDV